MQFLSIFYRCIFCMLTGLTVNMNFIWVLAVSTQQQVLMVQTYIIIRTLFILLQCVDQVQTLNLYLFNYLFILWIILSCYCRCFFQWSWTGRLYYLMTTKYVNNVYILKILFTNRKFYFVQNSIVFINIINTHQIQFYCIMSVILLLFY